MWQVVPLQKQMMVCSQSPQFDKVYYQHLTRRWEWWGLASLLTPVASLALMVLKPVW